MPNRDLQATDMSPVGNRLDAARWAGWPGPVCHTLTPSRALQDTRNGTAIGMNINGKAMTNPRALFDLSINSMLII